MGGFAAYRVPTIRPARIVPLSTLLAVALVLAAVPKASAGTVVTLTFDDGRSTQYQARAPLASHGMHGTFFINSGLVPATTGGFRMTWSQVHDLDTDGNEIAGHTLSHQDLTTLTADAQRHEICDDRTNLLNQGFSPVTSFAYPLAAYNATVQSTVQQCGYTAARGGGGIKSASTCSSCPFAETIPPADPVAIRTPDFTGADIPLSKLQQLVTQSETNGGGWVVMAFHDICDTCDPSNASVTLSTFDTFLDWLRPRAANGTVVKTMGEVMGAPAPPAPPSDTTAPVTTISCNESPCLSGSYRGTVTVALSATDSGGAEVASTRYTTNGSTPTTTNGIAYSGPFTLSTTTTVKFRSWDKAGNAESTKSRRIKARR